MSSRPSAPPGRRTPAALPESARSCTRTPPPCITLPGTTVARWNLPASATSFRTTVCTSAHPIWGPGSRRYWGLPPFTPAGCPQLSHSCSYQHPWLTEPPCPYLLPQVNQKWRKERFLNVPLCKEDCQIRSLYIEALTWPIISVIITTLVNSYFVLSVCQALF